MYSLTSDTCSRTILSDSRNFHARLSKMDRESGGYEQIQAEIKSIKYTNSSVNEGTITLGSTVSACIEVEMDAIDIQLENQEIQLEIGVMLPTGIYEYIPVGYFTVEKPSTGGGITKFTAYDRMLKFNKSVGDFPAGVYTADSLLEMLGGAVGVKIIVPDELKGVNYGHHYRWMDTYTYREAIGYFASYYGYFATINRDGELEFKWYKDNSYNIDTDRYFSFEKSDTVYKISLLECITGTSGDTSVSKTSGTGPKGISFCNPVMTQHQLDGLYSAIGGMAYQPSSIRFIGDIRIDVGDIITVTDEKGLIHSVPVMNLAWEYDGGIATEVEAVGESDAETEVEFVGPMEAKIERVITKVNGIDKVIAEKADITQLNALSAEIGNLSSKAITTDNLTASVANIAGLTADDAIIWNIKSQVLSTDSIKAAVADVGYLTADAADIKYAAAEKVEALEGNFKLLQSKSITADNLNSKVAEIGYITAAEADIKYASIESLAAAAADINNLSSKAITTDNLTASVANIAGLTADDAIIQNIKSQVLSTDSIKAAVADMGYLTAGNADLKYLTVESAESKYLKAESANLKYAYIDFANVEKESVGMLLAGVGLISSAIIQNGHVTGYLDAVDINADRIKAGTLSIDRLIINGTTDSIIYALNNAGELQSVHCDTLDGGLITKHSLTADHIVAKSLTANEINVDSLFSQNITATGTITGASLYGGHFESNDGIERSVIEGGYIHNTGNAGYSNVSSELIMRSWLDLRTISPQPVNSNQAASYYYRASLHPDSIEFFKSESANLNSANAISIFRIDAYNNRLISELANNDFGYTVSAKAYIEDGTPVSLKYAAAGHTHDYLPVNGGTLTGSLVVKNYLKVGTESGTGVELAFNTEGGNVAWYAPDKTKWEFDCYNNQFRLFNYATYKNFIIDKDGNVKLPGTLTIADKLSSPLVTSTHLSGNQGQAIINSTAPADSYVMLAKMNSTNGYFTHGVYKAKYELHYTAKSTVDAGTNAATHTLVLMNEQGEASFPGNVFSGGYIKTDGSAYAYRISAGGKAEMWTDSEGGTLELKAADNSYGFQMDVLAKNAIRMYCYKVSPWTLMNSVVFDCDGNFKAKNFMEDGLSLSAKYAAASHTHNYLPLSGGTLSGNLTINGNLNGYNIGGSVANSNNGFITGGAVYNALGNVQIIEILDTGKLITSAAVANGGTATLNTGFVMWQGADRHVVIPTQTSYCNVDAVALNSAQDSLNITLRNTSGASHTLSARFLIIYYKYK